MNHDIMNEVLDYVGEIYDYYLEKNLDELQWKYKLDEYIKSKMNFEIFCFYSFIVQFKDRKNENSFFYQHNQ